MTDTQQPYGDPAWWDEIPPAYATALTEALNDRGWAVTDAHETAITVDAPGLVMTEDGDEEEWCLGKPNFHGLWFYGVYVKGVCQNPEFLHADAADPRAVAAAADEVLRARRAA